MKSGETVCFYRARGGGRSIYVTMLYDKNDLIRGSIMQNHFPQTAKDAIKKIKDLNNAKGATLT